MNISHANLNEEKKHKTESQIKSKNSKIQKMENDKEQLDKEINELEKDYLKKMAELMVMTQVHCELKEEIYNEFNKLGVTTNAKEVDVNEVQSFNKKNN